MDILQQEEEKIARVMQELENESTNLLESSEDVLTMEEGFMEAVSTEHLDDLDMLEVMDSVPTQEDKSEEKKEEVSELEAKVTVHIQKERTDAKEKADELKILKEQEVTTVKDDTTMQEAEEPEKEEEEEAEKLEKEEEEEAKKLEKEEPEKSEKEEPEKSEKEEAEKSEKEEQKKESKERQKKAAKKTPSKASNKKEESSGAHRRKLTTQHKQLKREPKDLGEPEESNGAEEPEEPEKSEDSEDSEAEQYEIEKIVAHKLYKNRVVKYVIQWKGYGPEDNTSESADSIHHDVPDLCAAYWDSLPKTPRPMNAPASKNQKRKRVVTEEKESPVKRHKGNLEHVPQHMLERGFKFPKAWPSEDLEWDGHIKRLCAIQLSPIDKSMKLAYIEWTNGERTVHTLEECHKKCPMQLISFYEERLRFV